LDVHLYPEEDRFEYRWVAPVQKVPRVMRRLFWDTDPRQLDLEREADYIITRVAEKGDLEDWSWLRWTYGVSRIMKALQSRGVSPVTVRLWRDIIAVGGAA